MSWGLAASLIGLVFAFAAAYYARPAFIASRRRRAARSRLDHLMREVVPNFDDHLVRTRQLDPEDEDAVALGVKEGRFEWAPDSRGRMRWWPRKAPP